MTNQTPTKIYCRYSECNQEINPKSQVSIADGQTFHPGCAEKYLRNQMIDQIESGAPSAHSRVLEVSYGNCIEEINKDSSIRFSQLEEQANSCE